VVMLTGLRSEERSVCMAADIAAAASREEKNTTTTTGSQLADTVGLCVMETMSKQMESSVHSAYPWKILVPAERAKLPSKCKGTSRKMIDCVKAVELEKSIEPLREKCSLPEISVPSISDFEYHVLTVDDSKLDQKVVERLLKTSSYKVTAVNSALRALEYLGLSESCPPAAKTNRVTVNLIMTDYCMPEMTGYDFLKKLKASSAFKEIPVIVMSSENDSNRIESCLAEGAEEFLIKPVKMEDVKRLQGHIRPGSISPTTTTTTCGGKRKAPSDGLQPGDSPVRRARYSGVAVS